MIYNLTEVHRYHIKNNRPGTFGYGECEVGLITPGPIEEVYARLVFGHDFDAAIRLGVLVPIEEKHG